MTRNTDDCRSETRTCPLKTIGCRPLRQAIRLGLRIGYKDSQTLIRMDRAGLSESGARWRPDWSTLPTKSVDCPCLIATSKRDDLGSAPRSGIILSRLGPAGPGVNRDEVWWAAVPSPSMPRPTAAGSPQLTRAAARAAAQSTGVARAAWAPVITVARCQCRRGGRP